MHMDMGFVHMGGHYKLVLALGILHRQLIADAVGFFRADLPRREGLDNAVHQHVPALGQAAPGDLIIELLTDFKFCRRSFRGAYKGRYQLTVLRFLRLLVVVVALRHGLLPCSVPHGFAR